MLLSPSVKKSGQSFKSNMRLTIGLPLIISKIIKSLPEKRKLSNTIQMDFAILGILSHLEQKAVILR